MSARKLPGPRAAAFALAEIGKGWAPIGVHAVDGSDWITNGHVVFRVSGKHRPAGDARKAVADMLAVRPTVRAAKPGETRMDRGDKVTRIGKWFFDTRYVALVERLFPGASWHPNLASHPEEPAHVKVDGKTVALVMRRRDPPGGAP